MNIALPMEKLIKEALKESVKVKQDFIRTNTDAVISLARRITQAFTDDRKLLICGNGGSAADAQHIAAEFVNRFMMERPPLPALALTTDTSVLTSIGNDYSFDEVFSKQVKALGVEGDVFLGISTSGNSRNIVTAAQAAREQGLFTAGLLGGEGGALKDHVDLPLIVQSPVTARVQETHIFVGHLLCQAVDEMLFNPGGQPL
jgi:D-sedoheptulose 7-phosphate isomerase